MDPGSESSPNNTAFSARIVARICSVLSAAAAPPCLFASDAHTTGALTDTRKSGVLQLHRQARATLRKCTDKPGPRFARAQTNREQLHRQAPLCNARTSRAAQPHKLAMIACATRASTKVDTSGADSRYTYLRLLLL